MADFTPVPIVLIALLIPAIVFGAVVVASRYGVRRLPAWASALILPAGWTSYEFLSSLISVHGTGGSLGYSQVDFLALIQVASITGLWGVTFVLILVPSAIGVAWHRAPLHR